MAGLIRNEYEFQKDQGQESHYSVSLERHQTIKIVKTFTNAKVIKILVSYLPFSLQARRFANRLGTLH